MDEKKVRSILEKRLKKLNLGYKPYSLERIHKYGATYNVIFGERSNGKTYGCILEALIRHGSTGEQFAYIRRWEEDIKGKRGATLFSSHEENGVIELITDGEWSGVYYNSRRWYFCKYDENGKRIVKEEPFAFAFAISSSEHDKSTSYPGIKTIIFDEFITRDYYFPDEFVKFMNLLSTIIRHRPDVRVYMLGNTVNKYCPYFSEMGLNHVVKMSPGDMDLYTYGESNLSVAVEYTERNVKGKESDKYFAFDNPKLSMITGGAWEIDIYPHCPCEYLPKNVIFNFFIEFSGSLLHCEVVELPEMMFIFIHPKTTPLKNPDNELVYSPEYNPRPNYRRKITRAVLPVEKKISLLFNTDKVFYSNNEVGEVVRNYLKWCSSN